MSIALCILIYRSFLDGTCDPGWVDDLFQEWQKVWHKERDSGDGFLTPLQYRWVTSVYTGMGYLYRYTGDHFAMIDMFRFVCNFGNIKLHPSAVVNVIGCHLMAGVAELAWGHNQTACDRLRVGSNRFQQCLHHFKILSSYTYTEIQVGVRLALACYHLGSRIALLDNLEPRPLRDNQFNIVPDYEADHLIQEPLDLRTTGFLMEMKRCMMLFRTLIKRDYMIFPEKL
jgi:hypothetical protein